MNEPSDWRGEYRGAVPKHVAVCGYCDKELFVVCIPAMEIADGGREWKVCEVELECETEPDIDDYGYDDWFATHSDMPYVNALPQHQRVIDWLNRRRKPSAVPSAPNA